jgi:hypothetical protein
MYPIPPLEAELDYDGGTLTYAGAISVSFGMDFVEVELDPGLPDQALQVSVRSDGAKFDVRVWKLGGGEGTRPWGLTRQPEAVPQGEDGLHASVIDPLYPARSDRLALILTRLDSNEEVDAGGGYTITLAFAD